MYNKFIRLVMIYSTFLNAQMELDYALECTINSEKRSRKFSIAFAAKRNLNLAYSFMEALASIPSI